MEQYSPWGLLCLAATFLVVVGYAGHAASLAKPAGKLRHGSGSIPAAAVTLRPKPVTATRKLAIWMMVRLAILTTARSETRTAPKPWQVKGA